MMEFVYESLIQSNLRKVVKVVKVGVVFTSHHVPDITTLAAVRSGRSDLLAFSAIHVTEKQIGR